MDRLAGRIQNHDPIAAACHEGNEAGLHLVNVQRLQTLARVFSMGRITFQQQGQRSGMRQGTGRRVCIRLPEHGALSTVDAFEGLGKDVSTLGGIFRLPRAQQPRAR